jgi:3-methyladenine DNA glycosylase AlkC
MPELLKNYFSKKFVEQLSEDLRSKTKQFNKAQFLKHVLNADWENRELKDRMHCVAREIGNNLELDYTRQLSVLYQIAPNYNGLTGMVFPDFVEIYGQEDETRSMEALKFFTPFSTSEFAIRPFLKNNPALIKTLYSWSNDKNHHVRRLSSEGCRPLLPWAMKLDMYVKDPQPLLPILDKLKNDREDYVYRSVANNLNDISKHHPKLVLDLGKKWKGHSKTTDWVLKHGLRTLLKKGEPQALNLFGFNSVTAIQTELFQLAQKKIKIGNSSTLEIRLKNSAKKNKLRLEYVVSYLKKNGTHNDKVFQISEKEFEANQLISISKKLDFKNLSTRTHHAGKHVVSLKVNGVERARIEFLLVD